MNKVIFNIFVWPLLLAISCFTALGISTTNKLKAENLALAKQIGSLEKPKQTSGVMEGVFGAKVLEINPAYEGPPMIVYVSIMKVDDIVEMRGLGVEGMDGDFKYNEEDNNLYLYFNEQIYESGYLKPDYENEKYFIISSGYANPVEMCKVSSDVAFEQMMIAKNNEIESLNRRLSSADARADEASSRYLAKVRELETAQATLLEHSGEIDVRVEELTALKSIIIEREQKIAELEKQEKTTEVEAQIAQFKEEISDTFNRIDSLLTECADHINLLIERLVNPES